MGERVKLYTGKTGGGGDESGRSFLPLSPSSLPSFFFFFVNFSPALYYLNAWNRLMNVRKLYLLFSAPCPFRVPFTFAPSPLSESLEQATLIQVCHSRSSSRGFAQILLRNSLRKSCCLVNKKTKGSHNFNLILSVF